MTPPPEAQIQPIHGTAGPVMMIGGAEDKRRDRVILTKFIEYAGGADSRIVVVSTASSFEMAASRYAQLFTELGAGHVVGIRPMSREEANAPEAYKPFVDATGVFLTGGNQLRLVTVVGATR